MKENYIDSWNKNYLNKRFNLYPYSRVVSFVLKNFGNLNRSNVKILDLGCGGGNHVKFLSDEGFNYFGVDGSPESIRLTKKLVNLSQDSDRVIVSEFNKLPYKNTFFDCVIDRQSMGHNTFENIPKIIQEIFRILKKGGVFHSHVFGTLDSGFLFGENLGDNDFINFSGGHFKQSHMVHAFSHIEIKDLFQSFSNLEIEKEHVFLGNENQPSIEKYIINATK